MPKGPELHGIILVVATPFLDEGAVDYDGLRAVARYCLAQGAHGLAATGEASESSKLTPEERRRSVEIIAEELRGQAWLVVGVTAPERSIAAALARHAASMGAAAVFATPRGEEGGHVRRHLHLLRHHR